MADFSALFNQKRKLESQPSRSGQSGSAPTPRSASNFSGAVLDTACSSSGIAKKKKKKKRKQSAVKEQQQQQQRHQSRPLVADGIAASASAVPKPGASEGRLQRKMAAKLAGAQFRYINEQLYTRPSADAVHLFAEEPRLYEAYHEGFRLQARGWPQRPVQLIAEWLKATQPPSCVVADLGCGDAELAASVPQRVHSFDLVACNEHVVACDIAHVPLGDASVDVAVFCLALMGTNFVDFLREAHRLLSPDGVLKIAEVSSRIADTRGWVQLLYALGFDERVTDTSNSHFVLFEFTKSCRKPEMDSGLPDAELKPCIYKRR